MRDFHTVYLDNATTSFPKPPGVYEAILDYGINFGVSPNRASYDLAHTCEVVLIGVRKKLARLIGTENHDRVCFFLNATDALNQILFGVLKPGDRVVSSRLEHNSVLRPLHELAQRGVDVDLVPTDTDGRIDLSCLEHALKSPAKLFIMTHVSNVLGTIQPVEQAATLCRQQGTLVALDAAQSVGSLPIHVDHMGIDFLATSGHKSLLGPAGVGVLWAREGLDLDPLRMGGSGRHSEVLTPPKDWPMRLEAGTPNMPGIVGLGESLSWIEDMGVENIHENELSLRHRLWEGLNDISGVRVLGENEGDHVGIVSCELTSLVAEDAAQLLDAAHGIQCRGGLHCAPLVHEDLGTKERGGTLRFSVGPFNDESDVEAAIDAMTKIQSRRQTNPGLGPE